MPGVKGQVQARGVARRQAIIEAAVAHFARDGYRGTGIAAIAEQAGVTTGGVLHHFGSKEGLLVAVLVHRDQQAREALAPMPSDSVADDFARWAEVASWNEERAALAGLHTVLLAEAIDPDHPAHAYVVERNRAVRRLLERSLQRGVDRGELRADLDVGAKAAELQAFIEGAHLMWLHDPRPGALRDLISGHLDGQLALLRAPGPA